MADREPQQARTECAADFYARLSPKQEHDTDLEEVIQESRQIHSG